MDIQSDIPTPRLRRHSRPQSGPVPVARAFEGSSALRIARPPQALIVDDCRFIAERMAKALEARGFECTVARNGFQALELLGKASYDLFVFDAQMPMIDGFRLLRRVRADATHSRTPVLMLSAEHSAAVLGRAISLGANAYMAKPLQLRPLNAVIDSLVK